MATLAQAMPIGSRMMSRAGPLIAFAAAIVAALIQSFFVPVDCDVSWLITANEKLLTGARAYVDFLEVNPPASIWLYTPAVWLARQLHLRPEAVVVATFIACALGSIALTVRISRRLRYPPDPLALVAILAFVELLLPMGTFAQREHAALLLAAPALTAFAVLAGRRDLSLPMRLTIGLLSGLLIAIKPHFALAVVPAAAAAIAVAQSRALRPMIPIAAAAASVVAVYALVVTVFTPAYLQLLPMLADIYLPLREQWSVLLLGPVLIVPLAIYALAFALRSRRMAALPSMFLIGSAGFAVAALIQGKGYLNHALPGMALGFVGLALIAAESTVAAARRKLVVTAAAALACFELYAMASIQPLPGLAEAVEAVAPARPSVIALGPDLLTGHPLVRNVDGHWAGSRPALFAAAAAHRQLTSASDRMNPQLRGWYEADLDAFAQDVQRERPDVVLVDARPQLDWLRNETRIRRAMAAYRPRARAGDVEVWVRR
jgi:hypothetical protein